MKKGTMYTAVIGAGIALGVKATQSYFKNKNKDDSNSYLDNVGIPDQSPEINDTQIENAKMVSEGSSYGVHYYNQQKE